MKTLHGVRDGSMRKSQQGMASIVITMVTMIVISLIVLGFATISRREARQSLDQLQSTQAFYAAETGVEDTRKAIKTQIANGLPVPAKSNCTTNNAGVSIYPTGTAMQIDAASDISYTCLQVDPSPETVEYDGVDSNSTVVPLTAESGVIRRVVISWQPESPSGTPASCPSNTTSQLKPQSGANAWSCGYGMLRLDVTPTPSSFTRASISNNTYGAFFQPVNYNAAGTDNYAGNTAKARLVAAKCDISSYGKCTATIDNIPATTKLSLRLSSMYQASDIKVVAYNDVGSAGTTVPIVGLQAEVDVTGKATDVLRRIKVRLPLVASGTLMPSNAITSNGSICKRFATAPGYLTIPTILDADPSNAMCQSLIDGSL
jgi:Tfp pilus assembly protein PilX